MSDLDKAKDCIYDNYIVNNKCNWDNWSDMYTKCKLNNVGLDTPEIISKVKKSNNCNNVDEFVDREKIKKKLKSYSEENGRIFRRYKDYEKWLEDNKIQRMNQLYNRLNPDLIKNTKQINILRKVLGIKGHVKIYLAKYNKPKDRRHSKTIEKFDNLDCKDNNTLYLILLAVAVYFLYNKLKK